MLVGSRLSLLHPNSQIPRPKAFLCNDKTRRQTTIHPPSDRQSEPEIISTVTNRWPTLDTLIIAWVWRKTRLQGGPLTYRCDREEFANQINREFSEVSYWDLNTAFCKWWNNLKALVNHLLINTPRGGWTQTPFNQNKGLNRGNVEGRLDHLTHLQDQHRPNGQRRRMGNCTSIGICTLINKIRLSCT